MSVEDAIGEKGNYLTTSPNCRYYFQMVSISQVLSLKSEADKKKFKEEQGLSYKTSYKENCYKALQEQRTNERDIRKYKRLESAEKASLDHYPTGSVERIPIENRRREYAAKKRAFQKKQRELIKKHPSLERDYGREALDRFRKYDPNADGNKMAFDNNNKASYDTVINSENKVIINGNESTNNESETVEEVKETEFGEVTKELIKIFEDNKAIKLDVKELKEEIRSPDIIKKISGPDLTEGSCASLALAYAANKIGLDVTDYRDGISRKLFSKYSTLNKIAHLPGVNTIQEKGDRYEMTYFQAFKSCWEKTIPGKEYILVTGRHAAVIKEEKEIRYYLELQSSTFNDWTEFKGAKTLENRFGCKRSDYFVDCTLIEIESLKNCKIDFKEIMGYINTREYEQIKGEGGHEK